MSVPRGFPISVLRRLPGLLAAALCVALLLACSTLPPRMPETRRVAVLDFETPPALRNSPRQVTGWWFGAATVFQNPRAGALFADSLAADVAALEYAQLYPRKELQAYLAKKRELLVRNFPGRSADAYEAMLRAVSPAEYGRDLGVRQVLTGRILEDYTAHNRAIHFWHSFVRVRVDLWDAGGQVVWSREFSLKRRFLSQERTMKALARLVADRLDRDFFRSPAR